MKTKADGFIDKKKHREEEAVCSRVRRRTPLAIPACNRDSGVTCNCCFFLRVLLQKSFTSRHCVTPQEEGWADVERIAKEIARLRPHLSI